MIDSLINVAKEFVAIDTTTPQGVHEGVLFLERLASSKGLESKKISTGSEAKLFTDIKIYIEDCFAEGNEKEIIFSAPIRTSDPGSYSLWDKTMCNPFKLHVEGDTVYGLGVAKSKLDLLAKIEALSGLANSGVKTAFSVVGSGGETETESAVLKLLRKKEINPSFAYVGAPTDLAAYTAGCGVLSVEINIPFSENEQDFRKKWDADGFAITQSKVFFGKASHSSELRQEHNAIIKMLNYLSQLPAGIVVLELDGGISYNIIPPSASLEIVIDAEAKSEILEKIKLVLKSIKEIEDNFRRYKEKGFTPEISTLSLGKIKTFRNHIRIIGSCRILPSVPEKVYKEWLDEFRVSCEKMGGQFEILSYKRPFMADKSHAAISTLSSALESLNLDFDEKKTTHSSEANLLSRFKIPAVVFGAGMSQNNVNTPNESNSLKAFYKSVEVYATVMKELLK